MNHLDRLIQKEDFSRIIAQLTPAQLLYARLRLVGLQDVQIRALCGHSHHSAVSQTLLNARRKVIRNCPDLAHYMTGRTNAGPSRCPDNRVLDWDWIVDEPDTSARDPDTPPRDPDTSGPCPDRREGTQP